MSIKGLVFSIYGEYAINEINRLKHYLDKEIHGSSIAVSEEMLERHRKGLESELDGIYRELNQKLIPNNFLDGKNIACHRMFSKVCEGMKTLTEKLIAKFEEVEVKLNLSSCVERFKDLHSKAEARINDLQATKSNELEKMLNNYKDLLDKTCNGIAVEKDDMKEIGYNREFNGLSLTSDNLSSIKEISDGIKRLFDKLSNTNFEEFESSSKFQDHEDLLKKLEQQCRNFYQFPLSDEQKSVFADLESGIKRHTSVLSDGNGDYFKRKMHIWDKERLEMNAEDNLSTKLDNAHTKVNSVCNKI